MLLGVSAQPFAYLNPLLHLPRFNPPRPRTPQAVPLTPVRPPSPCPAPPGRAPSTSRRVDGPSHAAPASLFAASKSLEDVEKCGSAFTPLEYRRIAARRAAYPRRWKGGWTRGATARRDAEVATAGGTGDAPPPPPPPSLLAPTIAEGGIRTHPCRGLARSQCACSVYSSIK